MRRYAILRGWVTLRLNFRLKGYILRQCLWTIRWGNSYTTTLPPEVFTQRNFVADFIWLNFNFILKSKTSVFEPDFGRLMSNVHTPSIARWKARGRLPIRHNWTFFAISYSWDVICGNLSKSAFFEGDGSLWAQISEGMGRCPPTTFNVRKLECLPFNVVSQITISAMHSLVLSQSTREMDGHTELWLPWPHCIDASRGKNRFYRASICEGGLGSRNSVCMSVRLSVCHTRGLWQN